MQRHNFVQLYWSALSTCLIQIKSFYMWEKNNFRFVRLKNTCGVMGTVQTQHCPHVRWCTHSWQSCLSTWSCSVCCQYHGDWLNDYMHILVCFSAVTVVMPEFVETMHMWTIQLSWKLKAKLLYYSKTTINKTNILSKSNIKVQVCH